MVKHISKVIKETDIYKQLQQRQFEEFLPGISERDFSLQKRTQKKSQKVAFERKNDPTSET